ncbi:MAG: Peptidase glycoprotease [Gammaproteobacteria bacterium]|jgi:tRNA threonylcarbamoyladenosine biosynthesis protein TsaB|nr:Peptidase glycoprotease [Gammaproteobacteria bacterium]
MLNLLSFDMSMQACSVALMQDDLVFSISEPALRQQSRHVLSMIKHLLADAGISFSQLDGVAFGRGPGSFTGVRLSASVAQAIAFSKDLPIFPVSTLQALAQKIYIDFDAELICVALNAYAGDIYTGTYQKTVQPIVQIVSDERRCLPSELSFAGDALKVCAAAGDGWSVYADVLKDQIPVRAQLYSDCLPHAKEIARIAKVDFEYGRFTALKDALPSYLYRGNMWKKLAD